MQTIESLCGGWPAANWPVTRGQQSFVAWFSQYSFGSGNWEFTPITATSTIAEPDTRGVAQPAVWLPLWATGHPAAQCFWMAKPTDGITAGQPYNPNYIQVTGDPLVRR